MAATNSVPVERTGKTAVMPPLPAVAGETYPFGSLRNEIDRVFDDFFRGWPGLPSFPSAFFGFDPFKRVAEPLAAPAPAFAPKVDVPETPEGFRIEAEMPGMDEKDVAVTLSDGVLTIKGEKKVEHEEKKKDYYLSERSYGTVQRSFRLPESVDAEKISAEFSKGVLVLALPKTKAAKAQERTIEVKKK